MSAFWFAAIFLVQSQITVQVQPGTVTGRLFSVNGMPASGIRIAAVPVQEGDDPAAAPVLFGISQTEADGRYRIENIPPGRYYIFAGLLEFPSYYPNATTLERATPVVVSAGATLSGIDFTMARPAGLTVSGRLGIPPTMRLTSATVTLTAQTPRGQSATPAEFRVGTDGAFEFLRVSPGEYRLTSTLLGTSPVSLSVNEKDRTDVVIPVVDCNAGVSVSGRLVGGPASAIRAVSLTGSMFGCAPTTSVDPDGSFTFKGVPEGAYRFQLTPMPLGWAAVGLSVGKTDVAETVVRLPVSLVIKGRATVENGSMVPRTTRGTPIAIQARRIGGGDVVASILDDGTFELPLPLGTYRISVAGIPSGYTLKTITQGFRDLSISTLEVNEPVSAEHIQLTLGSTWRPPPGVRVMGRLSFAAAGVLPKSQGVVLVASSGNRNAPVREATLTADGSFEFTGVPPGIYNLETFPDTPAAMYGIVVGQTDVTGIEFLVPLLIQVKGGIEWTDPPSADARAGRTSVSVQFTRKEGDRLLAWGALAQAGSFHFYLPEGDYRFSVSDLPSTFALSSVTSGDINILENGLRVRSDVEPPDLRVMLRRK
jgi:hypothetical protein